MSSTKMKTKPKSGAQAVIESLKTEGVSTIFGIIGGAIMPIYDCLYQADQIKHITTAHEQGAIHAADGYARVTGKAGVCMSTSGPGATNLVTGLANAYMDSVPIVALTGQVARNLVGNDAFQEADVRGITTPITKYNQMVTEPTELSSTISKCFYLARSGRPAPVLLDVPKDVQLAKLKNYHPARNGVETKGYDPNYVGHPKQIEKALSALGKAERPLIIAGGGVITSEGSEKLRKLANKLKIPVTCTLMGLGSFPARSPLFLGMLGMHGTGYANKAVTNCDLLICVGTRLDDRITGDTNRFAPEAKVIHIDVDPSEIDKNVKSHIPIVGDAGRILDDLTCALETKEIDSRNFASWLEKIKAWKEDYPLTYQMGKGLKPQFIIEKLGELADESAIITTGVGQHQMWVAQYYPFNHPRTFVTSGGLGTMGFGFPAAMGAQVGKPDRQVVCVTGDGSFQMNIQELATCVREKLPITVIVLNNGFLGMVKQWQELFFERRYAETCLKGSSPQFDLVAKAYGAKGLKVTKLEEVVPALEEALSYREGPTVINCLVAEEENVFPMVPAGGSIGDFLTGAQDA